MSSRPRPRTLGAHHKGAVLLLVVVLFGALGACTDILGITDRQVTSGSGGNGGNGGSGGDSGECSTDADCAGSIYGERCDVSTNRCVECLPLPEKNTCAFGLFCDVTKVCAIGCATDADCLPPGQASGPLVCDPATHRCTQCGAGAPCPPGSKCELSTGSCVPGCDDSAECPTADWACCLKQCKNVTKDLENCGACEEKCVPDQSTTWLCLDGGCVFQSCALGWADCDQNLSKGNGCEVNTLVDAEHCGDCKTVCSLANADEGCENSTCTIEECAPGFGNCDGKVATGCETNLATDPAHCMACGNACPPVPNGVPACQGGECGLGGCNDGFGNCDGNDTDCETSTDTDVDHCGACGSPCLLPNATPLCVDGACAIDACDPSWADCDGDPTNGCEVNTLTSPEHCGGCKLPGEGCAFANAAASCNGGTCEMGECVEGFRDCNGNPGDGCETNVDDDEENCGECGAPCNGNNGTAACVAGQCEITCNAGFGNCNASANDGCEVNLSSSVLHCGECEVECPAADGTPYCFMGECGVSSCAPGMANCDSNPVNGCETSTSTTTNCGACGSVCSPAGGVPACDGATCSIDCNPGFGNCDLNPANGCEVQLNTNSNCTGCGVPCTRQNAFTSCGTGSCQIVSCHDGFADCNLNPADGCEVNLKTDEANCGGCNTVCAPPQAVGLCVDGACTIGSCNGAYVDCNGGVLDGCEANTNSDLESCGGCADACSLPHAAAACLSGTCQIGSCHAGFADCDLLDATGCEKNTQTDVDNCGACGHACSDNHGAPTCASGQCGIVCSPGYLSCNGTLADGCETSIQTLSSCGGCGVPCNLPHAVESCATGTCEIVTCDAGFTNCDGDPTNGCECGSGCVSGTCLGCGDGTCNQAAGEDCLACPADCTCECGNGTCESGESCSSCSTDCGECCGDGACEPGIGESCDTCMTDCGICCGNGTCEPLFGEDCTTCTEDCGACPPMCENGTCETDETCSNCPGDCGECCGDGMCESELGESCDNCPDDCGICCGNGMCESAFGEACETCQTDCGECCGNRMCDIGLGESCTTCMVDCGTCEPSCGNAMCEEGENCMVCPTDCGMCCGNGTCDEFAPESCMSCPTDCGVCCGNGTCDEFAGETCSSCPADCGGCCGNGVCDFLLDEACFTCPEDCGSCGTGGGGGAQNDGGGGASGGGGLGGGTTTSSTTTTSTSSTSTSTTAGVCPEHPGVACDPSAPCSTLASCCQPPNPGAPFCGPPEMCGTLSGENYHCDDYSDCAPGLVCCHTTGAGAVCTTPAACTGPTKVELCGSPSASAPSCECTGGKQCCPLGLKNGDYFTCQPFGVLCQ